MIYIAKNWWNETNYIPSFINFLLWIEGKRNIPGLDEDTSIVYSHLWMVIYDKQCKHIKMSTEIPNRKTKSQFKKKSKCQSKFEGFKINKC